MSQHREWLSRGEQLPNILQIFSARKKQKKYFQQESSKMPKFRSNLLIPHADLTTKFHSNFQITQQTTISKAIIS